MGRRGWAFVIIGILCVSSIGVFIARAGEWAAMPTAQSETEWKEKRVEGSGTNKIVQLFVDGMIMEESGYTNSFSGKDFLSKLDQILEDESAKAVVLRVNSPGGGVVVSDEIHDKIVELQENGKIVTVSMGSMAASGGYYISAPADYIYANPATMTGSLGVVVRLSNYRELAEKIGYDEYVIKSGEMKDIGNPLQEMTEEEKAVYQGIVDESYQRFVQVIVEGRDLSRENVLEMADGRIYSGEQAKELDLIDDFGSLEDATDKAMELADLSQARVVRYDTGFSLPQLLMKPFQRDEPSVKEILHGITSDFTRPRLMYLFSG